jgi:hypothetical protein
MICCCVSLRVIPSRSGMLFDEPDERAVGWAIYATDITPQLASSLVIAEKEELGSIYVVVLAPTTHISDLIGGLVS